MIIKAALARTDDVVMLNAPTDITYHWCTTANELASVPLRHDCPDCRDGIIQGINAIRAKPRLMVCVAQFRQQYLA